MKNSIRKDRANLTPAQRLEYAKLMVDESAQPVKKIVLKVRADLLA